jgi:hypothetical protein
MLGPKEFDRQGGEGHLSYQSNMCEVDLGGNKRQNPGDCGILAWLGQL